MDRTGSPEAEFDSGLLGDIETALGGSPEVATEETPTPPASPAPADPEQPSSSPETQPTEAPEASAATEPAQAEAPSSEAPTFTAPSGDPLSFRLDGREINLEGAVRTPDGGVYFSPDAFRKMHSSFLGDRTAWQRERQGYVQRIRQAESARSERDHLTSALYQELTGVLERGPEAVQEWLANFELERPLLVERARRRALEGQLAARTQEDQARSQEERARELVPVLQSHLERAFEVYLAQPRYAPLKSDPAAERKFRELVWQIHADSLFGEPTEEGGAASFNEQKFAALLDYELGRVQQAATVTKQVTQAAKLNAAAVQPTKPAPKPASPAPAKPKAPKPFDREQFLADQDYAGLIKG